MTPPRVLVNLLWLRPGRVGGSEGYLTRLLRGMIEPAGRSPVPELHLAVQPEFCDHHVEVAEAFGVALAPRWATRTRAAAARVAAEVAWLRGEVRRRGIDVVHHAGGTVAGRPTVAAVVTVHDVQYLVHPEFFSPVKLRWLRTQVPRALRAADVVAVPTRSVADMLVARLGVDPAAVAVVPHGFAAAPGFGRPAPLDVPYVLYPAVTWPHKNHRVLVEALARTRTDVDLVLVSAGGDGPERPAVEAMAARLGVAHRLRWLGRVDEATLDSLYRGAVALTFPSRFEGFGAPVVEAMARGCPVIAADIPTLAEVAGGAARLVDPDDVDGWATAIDDLRLGAARGDLVAAGFRRAEHFALGPAVDAQLDAWSAAHVRRQRRRR